MKVGIHKIINDENDQGKPVETMGEAVHPYLFDDDEAAMVWLIEACRKSELEGEPLDYRLQAYSDEGQPVERVANTDRDAAAEDARVLIQEHEDIRMVLASLIASRQLYAVAYREMERLLDSYEFLDEQENSREPHPLVGEVLVQTASAEGSRAFDEQVLFKGLTETVFPWLKKIVAEHEDEDAKAVEAAQAAADKRRRKTPIYTGVHTDRGGEPLLDRERPLILVGQPDPLRFVLRHIVQAALEHEYEDVQSCVIVNLADKHVDPRDAHARLIRLAREDWENCTRSGRGMSELFAKHVYDSLPALPDLFVVEDLPACHQPPIGRTKLSRDAALAQKRIMDVARDVGAGLVGGIPVTDGSEEDLTSGQWQSINAYCTLRPVRVIKEADDLPEGFVRIQVGRSAFHIDVEPEHIAPQSKIIIPG